MNCNILIYDCTATSEMAQKIGGKRGKRDGNMMKAKFRSATLMFRADIF